MCSSIPARRRSKEMDEKESEIEGLERIFTKESSELIHISYSTIKSITKNFYQVIGRGGFGIVYLGALRNDVMVAIESLYTSKDLSDKQFLGELKCLKKVNHKNIVRFLGYCAYTDGVVMEVEGEDRVVDAPERFLCFEYAPNGNLHDYLQEKTHGYERSIRYKIIKGICQGLHYLHQKGITNIWTSNQQMCCWVLRWSQRSQILVCQGAMMDLSPQ